jgi:NAD-dependent deacetylase sirtuin 4
MAPYSVPVPVPVPVPDLSGLLALARHRRIVALTGAGCSTESGIPDYRGEGRPRRRAPVQFREFVGSEATRRRYWARSLAGWPTLANARPNDAHRALAALEERGAIAGVITQNVDGLHAAAGSRRVVELHGAIARVRCLACGALATRAELQERLRARNPDWTATAAPAPDGDADVDDAAFERFAVEPCRRCDGVLKPDVVFFGENVPRATVDDAWALFDRAELLLVVGSSLAVFSGYRFVLRARERGVPIAIVNRGPTRADDLAAVRLDGLAGAILPAFAQALTPTG